MSGPAQHLGTSPRACPFVAFDEDRDRRADTPDSRHRCYALPAPEPRALAHQEAYCLSSAFPSCSFFLDWAARAAAEPAAGSAAPSPYTAGRILGPSQPSVPQPYAATPQAGPESSPMPVDALGRQWATPPPWVSEPTLRTTGPAAQDAPASPVPPDSPVGLAAGGGPATLAGWPAGFATPGSATPGGASEQLRVLPDPIERAMDHDLGGSDLPARPIWRPDDMEPPAVSQPLAGAQSPYGSLPPAASPPPGVRPPAAPQAPYAPPAATPQAPYSPPPYSPPPYAPAPYAPPASAGAPSVPPEGPVTGVPPAAPQSAFPPLAPTSGPEVWSKPSGPPGSAFDDILPSAVGGGESRFSGRPIDAGPPPRIVTQARPPAAHRPEEPAEWANSPRRFHAYPTLRGRARVSRLLVGVFVVLIAAVALFLLPGFLSGGGSDRTPRPSGPVSSASLAPTRTPAPTVLQYVVKPGDVLSTIAKSFGVTVQQIVCYNNLKNANVLSIGQTLLIPPDNYACPTKGGGKPSPTAHASLAPSAAPSH